MIENGIDIDRRCMARTDVMISRGEKIIGQEVLHCSEEMRIIIQKILKTNGYYRSKENLDYFLS